MPEETVPYPPAPDAEPDMPMYDATMAKLNAAQQETGIAGAVQHRPTITEILLYRKANLLKELEQIENALAQGKKNQGAMDLLDSIAKTGNIAQRY